MPPSGPTPRPATEARRGIQAQRHHENEIPQHVLIAGTKERREVSDGPEVCLDPAALTFDAGFLHLQVGEDLALADALGGELAPGPVLVAASCIATAVRPR